MSFWFFCAIWYCDTFSWSFDMREKSSCSFCTYTWFPYSFMKMFDSSQCSLSISIYFCKSRMSSFRFLWIFSYIFNFTKHFPKLLCFLQLFNMSFTSSSHILITFGHCTQNTVSSVTLTWILPIGSFAIWKHRTKEILTVQQLQATMQYIHHRRRGCHCQRVTLNFFLAKIELSSETVEDRSGEAAMNVVKQ